MYVCISKIILHKSCLHMTFNIYSYDKLYEVKREIG